MIIMFMIHPEQFWRQASVFIWLEQMHFYPQMNVNSFLRESQVCANDCGYTSFLTLHHLK